MRVSVLRIAMLRVAILRVSVLRIGVREIVRSVWIRPTKRSSAIRWIRCVGVVWRIRVGRIRRVGERLSVRCESWIGAVRKRVCVVRHIRGRMLCSAVLHVLHVLHGCSVVVRWLRRCSGMWKIEGMRH